MQSNVTKFEADEAAIEEALAALEAELAAAAALAGEVAQWGDFEGCIIEAPTAADFEALARALAD